MKRFFTIILILIPALFAGCNKAESGSSLSVDYDINPNPCKAQEEVTFTARVSGGKTPYSFAWAIGELANLEGESTKYTFATNGSYTVTLTVTDAAGAKVERKKNMVVNPAEVEETDDVKLVWCGKIDGYVSGSSVVIADDGSVYATSRSNKVWKFSKNGASLWEKSLFTPNTEGSITTGTPTIGSDGTLYLAGGSKGADGVLVAFNPDGSEKWRFKNFFTASGTSSPTINLVGIATDDAGHVYVGNTGTTGSTLSINAATGERLGFCKHDTGGPAGGVRGNLILSKDGYVGWFGGAYGAFGMSKTLLDGAADGADYAWRQYGDSGAENYPSGTTTAQLAVTTIDGKCAYVGVMTDKTKQTRVYALSMADGSELASIYIDDTGSQDQGGVVFTKDGYAVVSLNYTLGQDNGGVAIVDLAGKKVVTRYRVQEKLSGAAAIDAAGNIHFASEAGKYYVLSFDGSKCELLAKADLATLITNDDRYQADFKEMHSGKIWNSVMIGDEGKMYCAVTDEETRAFSGVVCLSYKGCKGPGATVWPMAGHDRRHTNLQK